MKKSIFTISLLFVSILSYSQESKEVLSKEKAGRLTCTFNKYTDGSEVSYFIFMTFKNAEYQHIIDIGSISIKDSSELAHMVIDLGQLIKNMQDETGKDLTWRRDNYTIKWNGSAAFSNLASFYDEDGKYTTVPLRNIIKLREWLKNLKFPA